jgi:hypothetical protein
MAVAVFCNPILIRGLGKERFGVVVLAEEWSACESETGAAGEA